jgi:hypothetical protein
MPSVCAPSFFVYILVVLMCSGGGSSVSFLQICLCVQCGFQWLGRRHHHHHHLDPKGIHEDYQFRGGRRDLKQFYEDRIQSSEKGFEAITNRTLCVCVCVCVGERERERERDPSHTHQEVSLVLVLVRESFHQTTDTTPWKKFCFFCSLLLSRFVILLLVLLLHSFSCQELESRSTALIYFATSDNSIDEATSNLFGVLDLVEHT